ncbi:Crp/Fnr family transcriptional regulator [Prolixibacter sp. SD074]|uniref:Crp/Fnr family transcriptional regulator n=1 Tax=Prolixibacter sp. SD074 TaxID=2652391 RepID=UPI0012723E6C|nr:Crp/Fnr family transcriptional regulator [Prolixibacter sp. SD074]GET28740.1 putative transcriptional regulator [Prolixibacter sp. SD074]
MNQCLCQNCKIRSAAANYLSLDELDLLGKRSVEVEFEKDEVIFKQDAFSTNIVYLREGLVKLTMRGHNREQILKIVKAPTYMGIPTTLGDKINNYSAIALTDVACCFIDRSTFKDFVETNGKFAYEILTVLSKFELHQFHRCANHIQTQVTGRVAGMLLDFSRNLYQSNHFQLSLTRNDLADLLGTSRETISRILTDFVMDKLIEVKGKDITILNDERLEKINLAG